MKSKNTTILFFLILAVSILIRLGVIFTTYQDINSDNGIMGLMAKHILEGKFSVFFYGQPYMGSLEAFVIAVFFFILGISAKTMSIAMTFITTLGIISAYFLGKEVKGKTMGLYAMLIAAVPPAYIFWHGLSAFGGYPEMLLYGNILFILALKIIRIDNNRLKFGYYMLLGFIAGIAFWTHLVIMYYLLPVALFLIINENKKFLILKAPLASIPFFILGSLPLWIYNINNNFRTFWFPPSGKIKEGFGFLLDTFPGLLSSKELTFTNFYIILLSIYVISGLFFIFYLERKKRHAGIKSVFAFIADILKSPNFLLLLFFISVCYFFSGNHMARVCCPRYLIPLFTFLFIAVSYFTYFLNRKMPIIGLLPMIFMISYNGLDIYRSYETDKKNSYYEQKAFNKMIDFLKQNDLRTNYCIFEFSQKLNFLSNEETINMNPEGERYIPYENKVEKSDRIAFIDRDSHLDMTFEMLCGDYSKALIRPFRIYYNFTPKDYCGRMLETDGWTAAANYNTIDVNFAFDRNVDTHWGTITPRRRGMFYELDLGAKYNIYKIALFNYNHWQNFGYNYVLEISEDGENWAKIIIPPNPAPIFWSGPRLYEHLEDGRFELIFEPVLCRYIKLAQNGESSVHPWEINEIFVWEYTKDKEFLYPDPNELYKCIKDNHINTVYADFWCSAKIDEFSEGKIHTIKPINKLYPMRKGTKRFLALDKNTGFFVNNENNEAFLRLIDFYKIKLKSVTFGDYTLHFLSEKPNISQLFFWSGFGLLRTNRYIPPFPENMPHFKEKIIFEGDIEFLGYSAVHKDKILIMNYFWQVSEIPGHIFAFVHFKKNNENIFQNDHPLLEQFSITENPNKKEMFKEICALNNIPHGKYDIIMGLWIPINNERLEIIEPSGIKHREIKIGEITIDYRL